MEDNKTIHSGNEIDERGELLMSSFGYVQE